MELLLGCSVVNQEIGRFGFDVSNPKSLREYRTLSARQGRYEIASTQN